MFMKTKELVSILISNIQNLGLWQGKKRNNINIFAKCAIFCFFFTFTFQLVALFTFRHDTEKLFECVSVIFFCGMGILKLCSLSYNRELWLSLLYRLSRLEVGQLKKDKCMYIEEYESDNEEDENKTIDTQIKMYTEKFMWTSKMLSKIYYSTAVIFILSPFVEYTFAFFQGKEIEEYPHILPTWNPFDNLHFGCYVVVIFCETVAALYCVYAHQAFDSTVIGIMVFICGQFSLLIYQSERIGGHGKESKQCKKRDIRAHFRITKCHRIHVQLVRSIKKLDGLLQNILGFYFFLSTLTLCFVAVRLKTEDMGLMQLVSLLQYMGASLTQLYIYCNYGDAVCNESTITPAQGPFGAAIWCLSPKIRRELVILGSGMLKARRLHAGLFNTVDLPSFIQIVRAAYSCYAVLGQSKQN